MFSPYLKRILIDICFASALILCILFCKISFVDFLISLFHFQDKVNISSLVYCIHRILLVLLPLILLSRSNKFPKIIVLKYIFIAMGICYLLGNTWIFFFLSEHSFSELINASVPNLFASETIRARTADALSICYNFQYQDAYVFNYLTWNSYDLFGVLFSTIQGILYIQLGIKLHSSKRYVLNKFILITVLSLVIPLFYTFVIQANFPTLQNFELLSDWSERNVLLIFSSSLIIIALRLAATSRSFWSDVMY